MPENRIENYDQFVDLCKTKRPDGKLKWNCENGKYVTLFGGEPNADNFWMWRELFRYTAMDSDRRVAFHKEPWLNPLHFVHVATTDPTKVAFVPDDAKGKRDIYTIMAPGRYLQKYYQENGKLTAEQVRDWANKHREQWLDQQVHMARTAKEIERCYDEVQSCMSKRGEYFAMLPKDVHPAHCYEMPDLAVAYLTRQGKVSARCVVRVDEKIYTRVYGDGVLSSKLVKMGYSEGTLEGASLKRINAVIDGKQCVVLPYVDNVKRVTIHDDYLEVTSDGDVDASCTSGFTVLKIKCTCPSCSTSVMTDKMIVVYGGGSVCAACSARDYVSAYDQSYNTVRALKTDVVPYNGDAFILKEIDYKQVGAVAVRDGSLWHEDYTVKHMESGRIPSSQAVLAGYTGRRQVRYALPSEVTLDWQVQVAPRGHVTNMVAPGLTNEGTGSTPTSTRDYLDSLYSKANEGKYVGEDFRNAQASFVNGGAVLVRLYGERIEERTRQTLAQPAAQLAAVA